MENLQAAMRLKPEFITIGEVRKLSRRKAKKLAYRYRGSRRGQWYRRYLDGDTRGFLVANNRLVPNPLLNVCGGQTVIETYHSGSAVTALERMQSMLDGAKSVVVDSPAELKIGN